MKKKRNPHIGSSLDDFLKEEGIFEEARAIAVKEALAWQVQQAMDAGKISKIENGTADAHKPRGSGPVARSRQRIRNAANTLPGRPGHRTRSAD